MITISHAIEQYIEAKNAQRISNNTLKDYNNAFRKLRETFGEDYYFQDLTPRDIARFLGKYNHLSKKTILNHHTALSSLWRWAVEQEIVESNIVRKVFPPRPETREIIPLTQREILALSQAANESPFPSRDRAILLLFMDTGMRLSEITHIKFNDINWIDTPYVVVMGKGSKERRLPISKQTVLAMENYLKERDLLKSSHHGYFFLSHLGGALTIHGMQKVIYRLSKNAHIRHVNPHLLRHTFAIWYLRMDGNIYVLQKILGHSTLDMVKKYLAIAESDIDQDHNHASPVVKMAL